jgi:hypothetical protein
MPGYPQAGTPLGIPETLQKHLLKDISGGTIVLKEGSDFVQQTPLDEIRVGFTNRRRVAAKRRGVVVGKMTLIYEKGIDHYNTIEIKQTFSLMLSLSSPQ